MDRIRNALASFGLNFLVGYGIGRVLRDRATGVRLGFALGLLGGGLSWRFSGEREDPLATVDTAEPVEIEIEE